MTDLLRKPAGSTGLVHDITPENAGWGHVGFQVYRLLPGQSAEGVLSGREAILVLVEGHAHLSAAGQEFGLCGDRLEVFQKTAPHCLYVPDGATWTARATTALTLAVCTAPSEGTILPA